MHTITASSTSRTSQQTYISSYNTAINIVL